MSGTTNVESSVEGKSIRGAAAKLLLLVSNQDYGFQRPCAAVTPRRNVRERIGHVCPTAFRHADPTRFADWIPGPIPWPITADRLAMVRESNSPGTSAPTVLAGLAFAARPTIHASVFSTGHTGQTSINPSWERFSCGVRGVGGFEPPGACAPAAFGTVAFDRSATTPPIRTKEQTG